MLTFQNVQRDGQTHMEGWTYLIWIPAMTEERKFFGWWNLIKLFRKFREIATWKFYLKKINKHVICRYINLAETHFLNIQWCTSQKIWSVRLVVDYNVMSCLLPIFHFVIFEKLTTGLFVWFFVENNKNQLH